MEVVIFFAGKKKLAELENGQQVHHLPFGASRNSRYKRQTDGVCQFFSYRL